MGENVFTMCSSSSLLGVGGAHHLGYSAPLDKLQSSAVLSRSLSRLPTSALSRPLIMFTLYSTGRSCSDVSCQFVSDKSV